MAAAIFPIEPFLEAARSLPVLDVRSPAEYAHAHIPGAISFPLFSDEERKVIGTAYKQDSRETAIKIGLDAFGPKMRSMVEAAEVRCKKNKTKKVLVHCWRGGMRSSAVAWLLDLYGFEVCLLEGGYKAYRQWVIAHWEQEIAFTVLAGNTGSGKTEVLHALQKAGEPVLDLEDLAQHKGSAFGAIPDRPQPTQEMFENLLAERMHQLVKKAGNKHIWVEDESQRIGNLNMPHAFFARLSRMPYVFISRPFEERLERIVAEYGSHPAERLINSMVRIRKRLGPLETKTAVAFLIEGNVKESFRILLKYYDKHYYPAGKAGHYRIDAAGKNAGELAQLLQNIHHEYNASRNSGQH